MLCISFEYLKTDKGNTAFINNTHRKSFLTSMYCLFYASNIWLVLSHWESVLHPNQVNLYSFTVGWDFLGFEEQHVLDVGPIWPSSLTLLQQLVQSDKSRILETLAVSKFAKMLPVQAAFGDIYKRKCRLLRWLWQGSLSQHSSLRLIKISHKSTAPTRKTIKWNSPEFVYQCKVAYIDSHFFYPRYFFLPSKKTKVLFVRMTSTVYILASWRNAALEVLSLNPDSLHVTWNKTLAPKRILPARQQATHFSLGHSHYTSATGLSFTTPFYNTTSPSSNKHNDYNANTSTQASLDK